MSFIVFHDAYRLAIERTGEHPRSQRLIISSDCVIRSTFDEEYRCADSSTSRGE
jgi:hypothetical protein